MATTHPALAHYEDLAAQAALLKRFDGHAQIGELIRIALEAVSHAEDTVADECGTRTRQALERAEAAWSCTWAR